MRSSAPAISLPLAQDPPAEVTVGHDVPVLEYAAEPWRRRDVIQFAAFSVIGLVLLGAGWFGAGGEAALDKQVPFINLAVAGLLVGATGGALWMVTVLRAVRTRKAVVKALIASRANQRRTGGVAGAAPDTFVAGETMTRYHRPDCSLVTGKPVSSATRAEHERAGRRPCGMCQR